MIPMEALGVIGDGVQVTDEVPDGVRQFLTVVPKSDVLVTTDREHPAVRARVAGETASSRHRNYWETTWSRPPR